MSARVALVSVALASAACAAPAPRPAPAPGEPIAPGMRSSRGLAPPSGFAPWGADVALARDARPAPKPAPRDPVGAAIEGGPAQAAVALGFSVYKATWSRFDGPTCAFSPSCSRFGLDAVRALGALGVVYTFGRLMRDHTAHDHYLPAPPIYLSDPLSNYTFFWLGDGDDPDPRHRSWQRARAKEPGR